MARLPRRLARAWLSISERKRLEGMRVADAGYGYDALGLHPEWVAASFGVFKPLYERYFRVESYGAENIPKEGAAILAGNHSGTIPIDATMVYMDVLSQTEPPRVARPVGDLFLPRLPIVGNYFARVGMVAGSRGNFRHLLESGELLMVFPEGTPGIGKGWKRRYQLTPFRVGFAELAIRHQVPVIPFAVIGAEEAFPQVAKLEGIRAFGAPYLPITATPLPMPARFHIHYGAPMFLHEGAPEGAVDDAPTLKAAAARVQDKVQGLIEHGLATRTGIFT